MKRLKAFISYSSKQKTVGGRFKHCLENYCGYEVFVAHSDMPAASIFPEVIIDAIKKSDFFIPLISAEFKSSDYSDQETGAAVIIEKKVIPIKLGHINPYGLINHIHALQYEKEPDDPFLTDNVKELVLTIAQIGLKLEQYHPKAIESLLYAFCNSESYTSTNATIEIMVKYDQFTEEQLQKIINAIKNNIEIQGAFGLKKLIKFLRDKYSISID
ncbi:MAG: toll/interleukin-1 receptor domain-containing protein [Candidatus Levyibacteriota bacterium]